MPIYNYSCSLCSHNWEKNLKIADRETPLQEPCPNCRCEGHVSKDVCAPMPCDPMRIGATDISKVPGDLKEIFQRIGKSQPGSKLSERYR